MRYVNLGNSSISVSVIGFGAWAIEEPSTVEVALITEELKIAVK